SLGGERRGGERQQQRSSRADGGVHGHNDTGRAGAGIVRHEWRGYLPKPYRASIRRSPMPTLDTLIPRFKAADRTTRLETLLDYSRKLPPLPERLQDEKARGGHRVHECQTPVYLWVEVEQ